MLTATGLRKQFNGGPALFSDQAITVDASTVAFVLGGQGSGKTTLLRILAGLERPTTGTVTWDREDLFGADRHIRERHNREVSAIFPDHGLLPSRTMVENLVLSQRLVGLPKNTAVHAAYSMLQRVDYAAIADRLPSELSYSQARLACVMRSVLRRPRLIIADEPDAQLDPASAQLARELLVEATVQGSGLILSQQTAECSTLRPSLVLRLEVAERSC